MTRTATEVKQRLEQITGPEYARIVSVAGRTPVEKTLIGLIWQTSLARAMATGDADSAQGEDIDRLRTPRNMQAVWDRLVTLVSNDLDLADRWTRSSQSWLQHPSHLAALTATVPAPEGAPSRLQEQRMESIERGRQAEENARQLRRERGR